MVLRIEDEPAEAGTVLKLIGRISSPDVQQLKARMAETPRPVALDLEQVGLVDLDAVHFLAEVRRRGVELRAVPPFVREWILLENAMAAEMD
jgi:hypothetical protein